MVTEIHVALVASITSIVVAAISLIGVVLSNQNIKQSQRSLEQLKFKLTQIGISESLRDERMRDSIKGIQKSIQAIQKFKDEVQIVIFSEEETVEKDMILQQITSARQFLFTCFEENTASLVEGDSKVVHQAKNIAFRTELGLKGLLKVQSEQEPLSVNTREYLEVCRAQLTEIQQTLRDSMTNQIIERINV